MPGFLRNLRILFRPKAIDDGVRQFQPQLLDFLLQSQLLLTPLEDEMTMVAALDFFFDRLNQSVDEEIRLGDWEADERVGGDKLGFQIRQGADAVVVLLVAVGLKVADEGDEEAELGDLDGDGLDTM